MSDKSKPASRFLNRWSERKRAHDQQASESVIPLAVDAQLAHEVNLSGQVFNDLGDTGNAIVDSEQLDEPRQDAGIKSPQNDSESRPTDTTNQGAAGRAITDADMPAIDSLNAKSDLSQFFNEGVSAELRKLALRQVFKQPQFNVRDGLNDYDGDYTVFEPLGDTITADMKFHAARKERERLAKELEAAENTTDEVVEVIDDEERSTENEASAEAQPGCEDNSDLHLENDQEEHERQATSDNHTTGGGSQRASEISGQNAEVENTATDKITPVKYRSLETNDTVPLEVGDKAEASEQ